MHRGRSDTVSNANSDSDAPRKFPSKFSSGASGGAPHGVAILKVRKGALDAGALGKVR